MNPSRKPFAIFTGSRTLNAAFLVLILVTALYLLLYMAGAGNLGEESGSFSRNIIALLLLISLSLLPGIPVQFRRALREQEPRRQEPSECTLDLDPHESRFTWKGTSDDLIPVCIAFLEKRFSRYYVFHSFRTPFLSFTYLAKTGTASLFALPWIKTGFVLFFLMVCAHVAFPGYLSPSQGQLLVLFLAVFFWIPGIWALCFHPYQKLWLKLLERGGSVQITVTCSSPFRKSKREALCSTLRTEVTSSLPERLMGADRLAPLPPASSRKSP